MNSITMFCKKCKTEKQDIDFSWKITNKRRNVICKECHRKYAKQHYLNNTEVYVKKAKQHNPKVLLKRRMLLEELKSNGCVVCGEMRLPTLQFHHIDSGEKDLNVSRSTSMKKIISESEKCVVLCANCHFIEHSLLREGKPSQLLLPI